HKRRKSGSRYSHHRRKRELRATISLGTLEFRREHLESQLGTDGYFILERKRGRPGPMWNVTFSRGDRSANDEGRHLYSSPALVAEHPPYLTEVNRRAVRHWLGNRPLLVDMPPKYERARQTITIVEMHGIKSAR